MRTNPVCPPSYTSLIRVSAPREHPGKCSRSGCYFASITTSRGRRRRRPENFPSKSRPELLGRLVRSRTGWLVVDRREGGIRAGGEGLEDREKGERTDEVSFRMLESPSGLQIANFRRAGSVSAFSADANARGWGKKDEGEGTPWRIALVIAVPECERTMERRNRAVRALKKIPSIRDCHRGIPIELVSGNGLEFEGLGIFRHWFNLLVADVI